MSLASSPVSREDLYELVWAEPMTKVAPRFGLSGGALARVCERHNIPRPPVGFWSQKQFGKQPPKIPLPSAAESLQVVDFSPPVRCKPVTRTAGPAPEVLVPAASASTIAAKRPATSSAKRRVNDEQLQKMIELEELPENRVMVPEQVGKYHKFVRQTNAAFGDAYVDRGLSFPRWSAEGATLSIRVAQANIPRALLLMDTLIKAFESRGHKVIADESDRRQEAMFVILGEKFSFRLRETTKMIELTDAERKADHFFLNRVKYEPTGLLELRLHVGHSSQPEKAWKDSSRSKLEDHLNDVLVELIVGVEQERLRRRRHEEYERQQREAQAIRMQQEAERRKENERIQELETMADSWDKANQIRGFINEVRRHSERSTGTIEAGSDLAQWMGWALNHADRIDPVQKLSREAMEPLTATESKRPNQPR